YETWYKMTQLVLGGFPLQKVLTHQLPVDEFQQGFELMETGKAGKVVLSWNGPAATPTPSRRSARPACSRPSASSPQIGRAPRLNSSHVKISYAVFCVKKK